jgi:hypothetical protein
LAEILEIPSECNPNNKGLYSVRNLVACSNGSCTIHAHSICLDSPNLIFKHHQLKGLTCFEIAHHPIAEGLWKSNSNFSYQKDGEKTRRCVIHSVSTDHPLYHYLRTKYGLEKKKRKRVCNNDNWVKNNTIHFYNNTIHFYSWSYILNSCQDKKTNCSTM